VIRQLRHLEFCCPVTVLVGENGIGKSTLLEALAVGVGFNPEGGGRNFATHSPILMAYPGAQLLGLSETGIAPLDYDDTEHVGHAALHERSGRFAWRAAARR
jgi:predicted ATPase